MTKERDRLVPCLAGCGYSVLTSKLGEPHRILVGNHWITRPGR